MNFKPIKVALYTMITSVLVLSAVQVYAQTTGVDLVALAQSKIDSILGIETSKSAVDLDSERQLVENQIYTYVDNYILGLQNELDAYTAQQEGTAKSSLDENYNNIKGQLDSQRQGLISSAEKQIDITINAQLQNQQNQLNDDLNKELEKKFK